MDFWTLFKKCPIDVKKIILDYYTVIYVNENNDTLMLRHRRNFRHVLDEMMWNFICFRWSEHFIISKNLDNSDNKIIKDIPDYKPFNIKWINWMEKSSLCCRKKHCSTCKGRDHRTSLCKQKGLSSKCSGRSMSRGKYKEQWNKIYGSKERS